jgi:hypothetical protein
MLHPFFNPLTIEPCRRTTCQKRQGCLGVNNVEHKNPNTSADYPQMTTDLDNEKACSFL